VNSKEENFCSKYVQEFDLRTSVVIIFPQETTLVVQKQVEKILIDSMLRLGSRRRRRHPRGSRFHRRLARILLLLLLLALPLVAAAAPPVALAAAGDGHMEPAS
jgi:hypothetical protein